MTKSVEFCQLVSRSISHTTWNISVRCIQRSAEIPPQYTPRRLYGSLLSTNLVVNGNGNGRLTSKQYKYILKLNSEKGRSAAELDQQCLERYGTVAQYLSKADASAVIEQLLAG